MSNIVLCAKKRGNTRKICDKIAELEGWECVQVDASSDIDLSSYNVVILATGVYGGFPHRGLVSFIRNLKPGRAPKQVHVLLTWLGRWPSDKETFNRVKKECNLKDIAVSPNYHKVLGHSFGIIHVGHPTENEIRSSVNWAADLKS